jgi:hypothetical protein
MVENFVGVRVSGDAVYVRVFDLLNLKAARHFG